MEAKENRRLKEIRLSIYLNHIDKSKDKNIYNRLLKVLSCVSLSISGESNRRLAELLQMSVCNGFARATHKELYATIKTYFKVYKAAQKLGISGTHYYRTFGDVMNMNYINDAYLESLKPELADEVSYNMVDVVNKFIEEFKLPKLLKYSELDMKERTLELDFMFVYDKLIDIFNNVAYVDKLIFNICNAFGIDYSTIAHLKNNMHMINRSYPRFRGNNRYLTQELVTLYMSRGYKKGTIGSKILGKSSSYLYTKDKKLIADPIKAEDMSWQYVPTIDWSHLDKSSVVAFLDIFQMFSEYDV